MILQEKPDDLLVAYVVYIKEQVEKQPGIVDVAEFKKLAVIRTNRGMLKPSETSIHFSAKYNNARVNLERNFPGDTRRMFSVEIFAHMNQLQLVSAKVLCGSFV